MIKILSKLLMILLISILFLNTAVSTIYAAIEINIDKAYIQKIGEAKYHLKYYREDGKEYRYLTCDIVGFYDENKNFNPAYCMDRDLKGAGEKSYYVTVDNILKNDKVWRVIKNGYPYKTAKELGLSSKEDAFVVTKHAVYCILGEAKLDYYKAEKNDKEALAMLETLKKLVNIGENGTEKQQDNPLSLEKVGELQEDGENYIQEYKLNSKSDFNIYEISKMTGITENGYIADKQGNKNTKFKSGENFKVIVPQKEVEDKIEIKLTAEAECKAYIILDGKTTVTKTQNYVVTVGEYSTAKTTATLEIQPKLGQVKVIKVDKDNNETKLEGVKFEVQDKDGNVLETLTTNEEGEATTSKYLLKDYENLYFKEIETNEKYVLDEEIKEVKLEADKIKNVTFENEKIKGKIKIVKTSKDDNKITGQKAGTPLEGVKFEIYNSENKLIEKVKTNKNGIAITSDLEKGDYKIKEVETNKYYYLNKQNIDATIVNNKEEVVIKITNESKNPDLDIEKNGPDKAEVGGKIEYDISLRNTGNTALENFTMTDILPSKYINVAKFKTGTYNQDLTYDLSYKTNMSGGYILLMEDLKTKENYEINFEEELADNEYVTEIKLEFGTADIGFCSNENPHISGTVKKSMKSEQVFENIATLSGECEGHKVNDKSKWKTFSYKLLPKTGF